MTEQLYRWVKASETPPPHYDYVFIRKPNHRGGGVAQWDGMRKVFINDYLFGPHGGKQNEHEWLEPYAPSPLSANPHEQILQLLITGGFLDPGKLKEARDIIGKCAPSGSLEDAAKDYAATGWKMIADGSKEYDKEKYEAFIAGAAYSRPSIDIVSAEKVLDFLLTESAEERIDMNDGEFYFSEDKDGDQPLQPEDIVKMFLKANPKYSTLTAPTDEIEGSISEGDGEYITQDQYRKMAEGLDKPALKLIKDAGVPFEKWADNIQLLIQKELGLEKTIVYKRINKNK